MRLRRRSFWPYRRVHRSLLCSRSEPLSTIVLASYHLIRAFDGRPPQRKSQLAHRKESCKYRSSLTQGCCEVVATPWSPILYGIPTRKMASPRPKSETQSCALSAVDNPTSAGKSHLDKVCHELSTNGLSNTAFCGPHEILGSARPFARQISTAFPKG